MTKIGDHDVSPYLTQRLRSIEEVQAEREKRSREFAGDAQTPAHQASAQASGAKATQPESNGPNRNNPARRPGQILDEKA